LVALFNDSLPPSGVMLDIGLQPTASAAIVTDAGS
jgi:hypothetical protein